MKRKCIEAVTEIPLSIVTDIMSGDPSDIIICTGTENALTIGGIGLRGTVWDILYAYPISVLASVIIRLALAETFCSKHAFLTLDEPTSNLDHENMVAMAASLIQLLQNLSVRNNYQLVVISHDAEFIELLARNEGVHQYYYIQNS
ncbi:hypothetical protein A3Q56_05910, partial [Intoshia linei]